MPGPGPKAHGPCLQGAHSPSLYLTFSSTMGVRQGHLPPWYFIPCTTFLRSPKKELGKRTYAFRAPQPRKSPKTVHLGEGRQPTPHRRCPAPSVRPADSLPYSVPEISSQWERTQVEAGEQRGARFARLFGKVDQKAVSKDPHEGCKEQTPTLHKGAPWSRRLACAPSSEARVSGGASASTAPHRGALGRL